jgi:hypothetical protein
MIALILPMILPEKVCNSFGLMRLKLARDASFRESRHCGVARDRRPQDERCYGRARSFAKPHAEIEERLKPEFVKEFPVRGFRRYMCGDGVGQRIGSQHPERSQRSGASEAVDEHRNTVLARGQRGAQDGGKLAPSQCGGDAERIAQDAGMTFHGQVDHSALAGEAIVVDAGPATGPANPAAAEQRRRDRGSGCRVADAHFAETDEVRFGRHVVVASRERTEKCLLLHRRLLGEVCGRSVEIERDNPQPRSRHGRELIDGGTAAGEIRHHLGRHLGRKRRNALCHDAVIAGKYQHLDTVEPRRISPLPLGEPDGEFFQATETARGLCKQSIAICGRCCGGGIGRREIKARAAQCSEGWEAHHGG